MGSYLRSITLRRGALIFAGVLLGVSIAWGGITGSISGVITDPSGGVIPGVTVMATSIATNVQHTTVTDSQGFYSFPALNVDVYKVFISHSGYRNFQEDNVKVDTNSAIRLDVKLELGTITNILTINANAVQVETESTQMGDVIEDSTIISMPLNGRSYLDLLALQPGVSPYTGNSTTGGVGTQSINGGRPESNAFMVNGADAEELVSNGATVIPNLDSIAEFRIITNNYNPEYGNFSGGQVNVVTKSGANKYHGDVFDFLRNTDLDAANYFTSNRGVFIQNQFGGTVGGPIKKDKVFFFGDYEGTRQIEGATQNYPVPSMADRSGNLMDVAGALTGTVSGPYLAGNLTQELGYTVVAGEPFYTPGCTSSSSGQCVFPNAFIPQTAWSPVAMNTLKYIPMPDVAGQAEFQTSAYNSRLSENKGGIRLDTNLSFGTLFGYYFTDKYNSINPYASVNIPGFNTGSNGQTQLVDLGLTTTINSSTFNDARLVYMREVNLQGIPLQGTGITLSSLGFNTPWNSTGGIGPINPSLEGVPNMNFNNYSFGLAPYQRSQFDNTFQVIDNFTKIIRTHTFQFGADIHYDQFNLRLQVCNNGQFGFSGAETGLDFADFLIGAPDFFIQGSREFLNMRTRYSGFYAQDSWRARPTLTINYGLRYEVTTPWYEANNWLGTLIPGENTTVFPGAPTGLVFPGDPGVSRGVSPIIYKDFAPRLGIAYAPDIQDGFLAKIFGGPGQSSIRAGYGIFYGAMAGLAYQISAGSPPFGEFYQAPTPPVLASPYIDLSTGHSEGIKYPFTPPPLGVSPKNPDSNFNWAQLLPLSGGNYLNPKNVMPYTQNFDLSLQRRFGSSTVVTASYVGTVGRHNLTFIESNPGDQALCLMLNNPANVEVGTPTCGPFGEQNVYTLPNGQTVNGTRPLLGINLGSNPFTQSSATSSYNSFQASLKHASKYSNLLIAYTFSKSLDNGSGLTDVTNVYNPKLSKSLSIFNQAQVFVASYTVQLPFNKFAAEGRVANLFTAGWAVSGITTLASGQPVTLVETDDNSLSGTFGDTIDEPSYSGAGSLYVNRNPRSGQPYFNPGFFSQEPLGQVGNAMRRFFPGPGIYNSDMALLKNTRLSETTQLQFRAEAFNVFNHAQFDNPSGNFNNPGVNGFGYVTAANAPRILQLALKLLF
jgi:Carboxypeptidase regulatory-like domain